MRICSYSSGACPAPWLPASSPRRVPPLLPTVLHAPPRVVHSQRQGFQLRASMLVARLLGAVGRAAGHHGVGMTCMAGVSQGPGLGSLQGSPSRLIHIAAWMQTSWPLWAYALKGPAPLGVYPLSVDGSFRDVNCLPPPLAAPSGGPILPVRRHFLTPSLTPRSGGGQERHSQVFKEHMLALSLCNSMQ